MSERSAAARRARVISGRLMRPEGAHCRRSCASSSSSWTSTRLRTKRVAAGSARSCSCSTWSTRWIQPGLASAGSDRAPRARAARRRPDCAPGARLRQRQRDPIALSTQTGTQTQTDRSTWPAGRGASGSGRHGIRLPGAGLPTFHGLKVDVDQVSRRRRAAAAGRPGRRRSRAAARAGDIDQVRTTSSPAPCCRCRPGAGLAIARGRGAGGSGRHGVWLPGAGLPTFPGLEVGVDQARTGAARCSSWPIKCAR